MKKIKKYVKNIDDELCSAERYAEKYIEYKASGDSGTASAYKEFAQQELEHADFAHKIAVKEIEKISSVFTAPADMREKWEISHNEYIERAARIKSMLNI